MFRCFNYKFRLYNFKTRFNYKYFKIKKLRFKFLTFSVNQLN